MAPEVAKLGHVVLRTPDLDESTWFFRDVIGLHEVERSDDAVHLRGARDWEHHTLSLVDGGETAVDHVAWRVGAPEHVDGFAERLAGDGVEITRVGPGEEAGQGEAIRVCTPTGHRYEFYYDVEKPPAPEGRRSRLHNRRYSPGALNRIAPRRIDHVHVQDPVGADHARWFLDDLDFELRERFRNDAGTAWGWWMSRTALPHDVAVHRKDDVDRGHVHHVCFHVDRLSELWDAADVLREHGIVPDGGPGMHAITSADFLYVKDPGSGFRLELFAGPGYLNFEPDWEPIEWTEGEIGGEESHQWIGTQFSADGVPYTSAVRS